VNDKQEQVEEINPADVVKELKHIRTSIDSFLDKFDILLRNEKYKPRAEGTILLKNFKIIKKMSKSLFFLKK
jgi:hypothetical protein